MRFRSPHREPPEINLIPFIDVLLVILIFLAASTSFTRHRQLQVVLPQAQAEAPRTDTMKIYLGADDKTEVKAQLAKGKMIVYSWQVDGGKVGLLVDGPRAKVVEHLRRFWVVHVPVVAHAADAICNVRRGTPRVGGTRRVGSPGRGSRGPHPGRCATLRHRPHVEPRRRR